MAEQSVLGTKYKGGGTSYAPYSTTLAAEAGRNDWRGGMARAKQRREAGIASGAFRTNYVGGSGNIRGSSVGTGTGRVGSTTGSGTAGSVVTSRMVAPSGPAPVLGPLPTYNIPKRDEARINQLKAEAAAPGIRAQKRTTRMALLRHLNKSPAVRKEMERGILAGHGEGLSRIMGMAGKEGRAAYEAEYQPLLQKAAAEYSANVNASMSKFEAAWGKYMAGFGKQTTTKPIMAKRPSYQPGNLGKQDAGYDVYGRPIGSIGM